MTENRPTPLPTDPTWIKKFNAAVGPSDPKEQQHLPSKMEIKYKGGVGELIWAMTTCRPDISYTLASNYHNLIRHRRNITFMASNTQSVMFISHVMMGSVFGGPGCAMSCQQDHSPLSTVTSRIFYLWPPATRRSHCRRIR
jgi:hypothetical protein